MNSSRQQPEGQDGSINYYSERLWPGIGICAFLTLMTVSLGIAYGHAYGNAIGFLIGTFSTLLAVGSLFLTAPVIRVDDQVLRAGKARLPLRFVGAVHSLDKSATKTALRSTAHRQAFLLVRSWIDDSIVVTVTDTSDPHPYWHLSSRKIEALLNSIESAKMATGGPDDKAK